MSKWLLAPDRRKNEKAPFDTYFGTDAPSAGVGSNGDYYFRHHDGSEAIYKKVSGSWTPVDTGFLGFDNSTNSELFELSSNFTSIVVTNFTITANSKLRVEKDGIVIYESKGWTRNTGTNAIDFDSEIAASADSKVLVFVGAYS